MIDYRHAMFPGTFDPPTNGHMDIIRRSLLMFDKLDIVIGSNIAKNALFSVSERIDMFHALIGDNKAVSIVSWDGLVAEYAKREGIGVVVRGVRAMDDFTKEFDQAMFGKLLNSDMETIFLPTSQACALVRSSAIKELACFGADIKSLVPDIVEKAVREKYHLKKQG